MGFSSLNIHHFRNIEQAKLHFSPSFNYIYGKNGSGKTSLLEAVHVLNLGRSFRTQTAQGLIQQGFDRFILYGLLDNGLSIGIEKNLEGQTKFHLANHPKAKLLDLVSQQPLQWLHSGNYELIDGDPSRRRKFMDWGLFHVEPRFHPIWQKCKQLLQHRNASLKQQLSEQQICIWDPPLIEMAQQLTKLRKAYLDELTVLLRPIVQDLLHMDVHYALEQGWPADKSYSDCLDKSFFIDKKCRFTRYGPHRADLSITVNGILVEQHLSRGQKKLLICAMHLAQGLLLHQKTAKHCLYLIDDLPSELDQENQHHLLSLLTKQFAQTLITGIEANAMQDYENDTWNMFHVEHGVFKTCK